MAYRSSSAGVRAHIASIIPMVARAAIADTMGLPLSYASSLKMRLVRRKKMIAHSTKSAPGESHALGAGLYKPPISSVPGKYEILNAEISSDEENAPSVAVPELNAHADKMRNAPISAITSMGVLPVT
mgnify:CR=1 FL=1